jgi:hypothetical protein
MDGWHSAKIESRVQNNYSFAESLAGWLSAKTFYYFFKKIFAESQLSRLSAKLEIFFVYIYIYITNPHVYITIHIYITHETYRSPQISQIHIDMTNLT